MSTKSAALALIYLLLTRSFMVHSLPYIWEGANFADEDHRNLSIMNMSSLKDMVAYGHRDQMHFKFSGLHEMEVVYFGHASETQVGQFDGALKSWFRDHTNASLATACRVSESAHYHSYRYEADRGLDGIYPKGVYNPNGNRYCIFPSYSLGNNGLYHSPYFGPLDCQGQFKADVLILTQSEPKWDSFNTVPGVKCLSTTTYEAINHLVRKNDVAYGPNVGRGAPFQFRCFFNTLLHTHTAPWQEVPTTYYRVNRYAIDGSSGSRYDYVGNFVVHDFFSFVNEFCFWGHCDPIIFLQFGNSAIDNRFGGYYMLEPNEATRDWNERYGRMGYSQYRHVRRQKWITVTKYDVVDANQDIPDKGYHWAYVKNSNYYERLDEKVEFVVHLRELDYTKGITVPQLTAVVKKEDHFYPNRILKEMSSNPDPDNKKYFCLRGMLESHILEPIWKWSQSNTMGGKAGEIATNFTIKTKGSAPLRTTCGIGFRPSENYPLNSGRQPWLVQVLIKPRKCFANPDTIRCSGTVISPRHILTAASCLCSRMNQYNVFPRKEGGSDSNKDSDNCEDPKMTGSFRHHNGGEHMDNEVCVYMGNDRDVQGRPFEPAYHSVIWVSFHRSYTKTAREYDVAILGLKWNLQFSVALSPICLPDTSASDTNALPHGVLLYSLKALRTDNEHLEDGFQKPYTNANGHSIYAECESSCEDSLKENAQSLEDYLISNRLNNDKGKIYDTFPMECQHFWKDFEDPSRKDVREMFHKGWIEPQAHIKLKDMDLKNSKDEPMTKTCFDTRKSSYRMGWCKTVKFTDQNNPNISYFRSWGFCDDSKALKTHPTMVEVETTLVPPNQCGFLEKTLTKVCTSYIPHKPSVYVVEVRKGEDTKRHYTVHAYQGGFYRPFIPKIHRRVKKLKFDEFGNIIESQVDAAYHSGFPERHGICHNSRSADMDVGAPTYARTSRLTNPETTDTTQEPTGQGVSHNILVSIQTGWSETGFGKICKQGEGSYFDVETLITSDIAQFIESEIRALEEFDKVFRIEDYKIKLTGQKTTDKPGLTTATTKMTEQPSVEEIIGAFDVKVVTQWNYPYPTPQLPWYDDQHDNATTITDLGYFPLILMVAFLRYLLAK